jgi:hypothetical protein
MCHELICPRDFQHGSDPKSISAKGFPPFCKVAFERNETQQLTFVLGNACALPNLLILRFLALTEPYCYIAILFDL